MKITTFTKASCVIALLSTTTIPVFADCYSCSPQCVVYARDWLHCGYQVAPVGTALGWLDRARADDHDVSKPLAGRVMVLSPQGGIPSTGHAICITSGKQKGQTTRWDVTLAHSNYNCACSIETGVAATYNTSTHTLKISSGAWAGRQFSVAGIIRP